LDTKHPASLYQARDLGDSLERGGFHDLQFKPVWSYVAVGRELCPQTRQEVFLLQMVCGDVDADRDIQPLSMPCRHLRQRRFQHPISDAYLQVASLDQRQELAG